MTFTWRCQKCSRYLANIELPCSGELHTQRTVCPRCKSENKVTVGVGTVIVSCGFSLKTESNLKRSNRISAPETKKAVVENSED